MNKTNTRVPSPSCSGTAPSLTLRGKQQRKLSGFSRPWAEQTGNEECSAKFLRHIGSVRPRFHVVSLARRLNLLWEDHVWRDKRRNLKSVVGKVTSQQSGKLRRFADHWLKATEMYSLIALEAELGWNQGAHPPGVLLSRLRGEIWFLALSSI